MSLDTYLNLAIAIPSLPQTQSQVGKQKKQNKFATQLINHFFSFNIFFYNVQLSITMFVWA